jgi:hypothetical protein
VQNQDYPHRCPVTHFLALALADKAFQGITDLDQLMLLLENREFLALAFKESILEKPVFRSSLGYTNNNSDLA